MVRVLMLVPVSVPVPLRASPAGGESALVAAHGPRCHQRFRPQDLTAGGGGGGMAAVWSDRRDHVRAAVLFVPTRNF